MALTSGDFGYICALVREHSALVLDAGKEYLVDARLEPVARREGFSSLGLLVAELRTTAFGERHRKVVEAMTNNETSFFRDPRVFGMFKTKVLPELLGRRDTNRSLNIWCAACSSGQEPYTVAMLVNEQRAALGNRSVKIVASDMSREILARARAGRYSQLEVNRGLPANLLVKHFSQVRGAWELSPEIRGMVQFLEVNLIQPWPAMPSMDVVFMRNVLIYFDVEMKRSILRRVASLLAPGGYLLLGGAETTMNLDDAFEAVPLQESMCFRLKESRVAPMSDTGRPPSMPFVEPVKMGDAARNMRFGGRR